MPRVVGLVCVVLSVVAAATCTSSALGANPPNWTATPTFPAPGFTQQADGSYKLTSSAMPVVQNAGYAGNFVGADGSVDTAGYGYMQEAQAAGRLTPTLGGLGQAGLTVAVAAGAGLLFQNAVQMNIPGQGTIYKWFSGESWDPAETSATYKLVWKDSGLQSASAATGYCLGCTTQPGTCQVQSAPCVLVTMQQTTPLSFTIATGSPTTLTRSSGVWSGANPAGNLVIDTPAVCAGTYAIASSGSTLVNISTALPAGCTSPQTMTMHATGGSWAPPAGWYFQASNNAGAIYCAVGNTAASFSTQAVVNVFLTHAGTGIPINGQGNSTCSSATAYNMKLITDTSALHLQSKPASAGEYAGAPNKTVVNFTQPNGGTMSAADQAAFLAALGLTQGRDPATLTPGQKSAVNHINNAVDVTYLPSDGGTTTAPAPGSSPATPAVTFAPFTIPRPTIGESYLDYIERLRELGLTGAVALEDDATVWPAGSDAAGLAPGSVVRVRVGTSPSIVTASRFAVDGSAGWPTNPPTVSQPTDAVTIVQIPGVPLPAPPGCNCPNLDLTPLASINYGAQFPFGVYTWLANAFDHIGAQPIAITLPFTDGSGQIHAELGSSAWEENYRPKVFAAVEFMLSILAVLAVARWGLGLGSHEAESD